MILSRSPLRITLGGGSTDLRSFYSKYGGFMITAGINRYCTIMIDKRFQKDIQLMYSANENVKEVKDIRHNIFREALQFVGVDSSVEIHSSAYLPSNAGLGSSFRKRVIEIKDDTRPQSSHVHKKRG